MSHMRRGKRCAVAVLAAAATLIVAGCGRSASDHSQAGSAPSATSVGPVASRVPQVQGSATGKSGKASKAAFGLRPTHSSDNGFDISVSPDRQAFTIRFSDLEARVGAAGQAPTPIATRMFSLVLPVDGGDDGVDISFGVSGYAFATEGTSGFIVFDVNGDTHVERLMPGTDSEFVHQLKFDGVRKSECQLSVFLLVERDSTDADGVAYLNVSTIDAEIRPRVG